MIKVHMVRSLNGLTLASEELSNSLDPIPRGTSVMVSITVPNERSMEFHRKYFALLRVAHDNMEERMPFDSFRKWLALSAGYFDMAPNGALIPKSIAFGKMGAEEFRRLYNDTLDYCLANVLPAGTTREDVDEAIAALLGFI